jgi:tetrahedral aminopeptidase
VVSITVLDVFKVMKNLTSAPAVPGFEEQRRKLVVEQFSKYCDKVSVDVLGNVIGTLGEGERSVMISAHYDQLGFMIKNVDSKGYASIVEVGGWDPRAAYGLKVKIWVGNSSEDYVKGVISMVPPHVSSASDRDKVPPINKMTLDFGANSDKEADEMGVLPGCVCTPDVELDYLGRKGSDLVVGPSCDDVSAVVSLLVALEELRKNQPKGLRVYIVATSQEEVGSRGAYVSGYNLNSWCTLNSDTTSVLAPDISASLVGNLKLGGGPIICLGPAFNKTIWELMMKVADERGIPHQRRGVPSRSGNDSWELQVAKGGAFCGLLSMPNRYMHSAIEVVSLKDVENTGKLFAYTTQALAKTELKHTVDVFTRKS